MSQKSDLLAALREGPVCSYEFYNDDGLTHRLAARIWDLKRDGHTITTKRCDLHRHHSGAVVYELTEQLVLL